MSSAQVEIQESGNTVVTCLPLEIHEYLHVSRALPLRICVLFLSLGWSLYLYGDLTYSGLGHCIGEFVAQTESYDN